MFDCGDLQKAWHRKWVYSEDVSAPIEEADPFR